MRKLLVKILSVIVALTAAIGLVALPKTSVFASEEDFTFGAVAGAGVKYGETIEETGLRFTIEVDKEFYAGLGENVKFGALITTAKYAATNAVDFNDQTGMIADTCYVDNANKFDLEADSDNLVYYASVTYLFNEEWKDAVVSQFADSGLSDEEIFAKAKLQALATELVCRPYYVIGEEVVYAELSDARSMVKVANAAVIDGEKVTTDFVAKYLSSVVESDSEVYIEKATGKVIGLSAADKEALAGATFTADDNAGDVAFAIENDVLTNAAAFLEGKTEGEYYYVTAFKGAQARRIKYLYVTMAIDEAEDLKVFTMKNDNQYNEIKGYYVVITVEAEVEAINEFDRKAKLNNNVLRHLVLVA